MKLVLNAHPEMPTQVLRFVLSRIMKDLFR